MTEEETKITTLEGVEFIDKDAFIEDVANRFSLKPKQATVVYHMALGDDLIDAVAKTYSGSAGKNPGGSSRATSNHYHKATHLMNMHKFQQALDYIGNEEFIELRLKRMKLHLLEWGKNKLRDTGWHPAAATGVWKTLMALAFEDKLPNEGKKVADNIKKLTDHFKAMDAAKKSPDFKPEVEEEGEDEEVKH